MKKNKWIIFIMVVIAILLCIPSIRYLMKYKTVDGFNAYYTYGLEKSNNEVVRFKSGIIVVGLVTIFGLFYLFIIKKEKDTFINKKQIILFIFIISILFTIMLPSLSSDIYYYIGDSWLSAKYNQNPYYTSVADLQKKGINDEILNNTGYWKDTTSVYGPLWNSIAKLLVSFSFGNVTLALFIFKFAALMIHILNSILLYKITKSRKYLLLYGLNPLVLIEFLSNVHNDIYLLLFMLLSIYFLVKKKNIYLTTLFLALSISIKFSTILLVPFILIYYFQNKSLPKKIGYCFLYGLTILAVVVILYLPYYQDMTIFTNMLVQGTKYSQSILLLIKEKMPQQFFMVVNTILLPAFMITYITTLITFLFKKKLFFSDIFRNYSQWMLIFILFVLTSFQKWYLLWLFPTILWQKKNTRKFLLYLTLTAILPSFDYFMVEGDPYLIGMGYSFKIIIISGTWLIIERIIHKCISILKKEKLCHS